MVFNNFFSEDNGETMIVRDCALDSGSLTTDTELVRSKYHNIQDFVWSFIFITILQCHIVVDFISTIVMSKDVFKSVNNFNILSNTNLISYLWFMIIKWNELVMFRECLQSGQQFMRTNQLYNTVYLVFIICVAKSNFFNQYGNINLFFQSYLILGMKRINQILYIYI